MTSFANCCDRSFFVSASRILFDQADLNFGFFGFLQLFLVEQYSVLAAQAAVGKIFEGAPERAFSFWCSCLWGQLVSERGATCFQSFSG